ncbi:hypothetical protein [Flavobacterium collinsii]|jgi:hypothetical protein|uniref:Uncharacterized protein n=1 Tax=Flavobacterium collinsii TaxID=1114861 RepID=A0A9W4TKP6_9FLAO|nr:hypothetical protein [Flavobacterium collinsii]GIQ57256.1 hypothetical protein Flavo103_03920 [Flavobacterium collinsii]CAA9196084.1 hypothetical protein FLACOL7796_00965 [Flavobacterium collinsii]CAI2769075.1 conserved protein of unknown function [Flavobacterium collinsii]
MKTNTLEKYKKAIRIKYEIEKNGENFDYLYNPSRGKLRDFCWLIFENNPTKDDLNVFRNLFSLDFDHTKKNKFKEQKDKFRPIETFFKGETNPSNIDAINLAAIMVDFQPRPFKKFNEYCRTEEAIQIECSNKAEVLVELKKEIIKAERFAEKQNEEPMKHSKSGNLFFNFKDLSKKMNQDSDGRKRHWSIEESFREMKSRYKRRLN